MSINRGGLRATVDARLRAATGGKRVSTFSTFQAKARTAETYLAGIGASGALMASAFVLFIVLVGVVTFNAWPQAGELLNGSGGNVSLDNVPLTNQAQPKRAPTPNLVALLGTPAAVAATPVTNRVGGGGNGGSGGSRGGGGGTRIGGNGSPPVGGGNGGGGGGNHTTVPPGNSGSSGGAQPTTNTLGQVVAGVGNNVESDTTSISQNMLGGTDTTLGGLVQGVGSTLNNTLQTLGGTK